MTSYHLNRADQRLTFAAWLAGWAALAVKLGLALLLVALCLSLTARAQAPTPAERNAGASQSVGYRISAQSVNGGGGAAKSAGFEGVVTISQQGPTGLLKSDGFQMELGFLTSDEVNAQPATVVSAASFAGPVAPGSIAAAFGTYLAMNDGAALSLPLPFNIIGTSVTVNGRPSRLFYVSDDSPLGYGQVNFFVPEETEEGTAEVVITSADGVRSIGRVQVERVAPGVFTANSSGEGEASALATADGLSYATGPFEVTAGDRPNFLILFSTGLRRHRGDVRVMIDEVAAQVTYAGPHGALVGLDQLNVIIPPQLRGRGLVNVKVTVDGVAANTVQVGIK